MQVRSSTAVARDGARHPYEELIFFGVKPEMTVVELWPGGGYWTDTLGPYLKDHGHLYVATNAPGNYEEAFGVAKFRQHLAAAVSFPSSCPISPLGCPERENLKRRTAGRPKTRTAIDDSVKIADTMKVN